MTLAARLLAESLDDPLTLARRWLAESPPTATTDRVVDDGLGLEARGELWRAGAPFELRERVAHLLSWHRLAIASRPTDEDCLEACTLHAGKTLAALVDAPNPEFQTACERLSVWEHAQVQREPHPGTDVTVLSGLPGAGKDRWLARYASSLAVVSLDALRLERKVAHGEDEDAVVAAAWTRATTLLRTRTSFAWNATNLRRRQRAGLIARLHNLGARVTLIAIDGTCANVRRQNASRTGSARVPEAAWNRLVDRWDCVWPGEADHERWFDGDRECSLLP